MPFFPFLFFALWVSWHDVLFTPGSFQLLKLKQTERACRPQLQDNLALRDKLTTLMSQGQWWVRTISLTPRYLTRSYILLHFCHFKRQVTCHWPNCETPITWLNSTAYHSHFLFYFLGWNKSHHQLPRPCSANHWEEREMVFLWQYIEKGQ